MFLLANFINVILYWLINTDNILRIYKGWINTDSERLGIKEENINIIWKNDNLTFTVGNSCQLAPIIQGFDTVSYEVFTATRIFTQNLFLI